jgi:carboxypeptidase C (cathepsin A)
MKRRFCIAAATVLFVVAAQAHAEAPKAQADRMPFPEIKGDKGSIESRVAPVTAPIQFISHHQMVIGDRLVKFTVVAGETHLLNDNGVPIGAVFSYSYIKDVKGPATRPVIFITAGGPGSSSDSLQLAFGAWRPDPRRMVIQDGRQPYSTPPYPLVENPHSPLDVADLVFIDPIGTGYSRPIGQGKAADFWGVDEDSDMLAQFIELWLAKQGRWDSPKFFLGESYGGTRAALVARSLAGGVNFQGYDRGISLNGVISLSNSLGMPGFGNDGVGTTKYLAFQLPGYAAAAWYHSSIDRKGRSLEAFYDEVTHFAASDYLDALEKDEASNLSPEERAHTIAKLVEFTGVRAEIWQKKLAMTGLEFAKEVLAARGLDVSPYDARFTMPADVRAADVSGDDPLLARSFNLYAMGYRKLEGTLGITIDRSHPTVRMRDLLPQWNFAHKTPIMGEPLAGSSADELAAVMRRNDRMYVMVATGYFDLLLTPALADYATALARIPKERLVIKRYASGHLPYIDSTAVADDLRAFIKLAAPNAGLQ